jgi:hypothetical protein
MRNFRLGSSLSALACLLAVVPGCQVMYRYRPVPVLVCDAETKKPITDAEVHLTYPLSRDSLAPYDSTEHTGADGIARLRAAPYGDFGVRLEATAAGYMSEQQSLSTEFIEEIKPPHLFEKAEQRPSQCVIAMYAEPRFSVELIVPTSYRGLIKADVRIQDDLPAPPGQRRYRFEVVNGAVTIKAPALLRRISPPEYRACYPDGTPVNTKMTLLDVGFRWLRCNDNTHYFVVGTQPEYDMLRRSLVAEEEASKPRSTDKSHGGRGGRHHRGGDN